VLCCVVLCCVVLEVMRGCVRCPARFLLRIGPPNVAPFSLLTSVCCFVLDYIIAQFADFKQTAKRALQPRENAVPSGVFVTIRLLNVPVAALGT